MGCVYSVLNVRNAIYNDLFQLECSFYVERFFNILILTVFFAMTGNEVSSLIFIKSVLRNI